MIRVADLIAQTLARHGITDVFLVTGGGAMHLNDAIGRCRGLRPVCCHHEQACAMAAESYFRLTGRLAAVNVTSGPGGSNAITGVHGAWTDSMGLVVISGQVKRETLVRSHGLPLRQLGDQELDITPMVASITKYAVLVTDPASIRYHLEKAIHLARSGRPGPVWLDVPIDVQGALVDPDRLEGFVPEPAAAMPEADLAGLARAVLERLARSERPVLLAGSGVRTGGAEQLFLAAAERLGIPVTTAFNAHDLVPGDHPLLCGRPGTIGDRAGNFAVQNSDFLLVLGCRLNIRQISYNWASFARHAYQVMVDIDAAELRKPTLRIDLPVHADAGRFLAKLLELAGEWSPAPSHRRYLDWCRERVARYPVVLPEYWAKPAPVNPYCFIQALFDQLRSGDITVTGNASACIVPFQAARLKPGQRLYSNSGSASMGWDLPAAIGAAVGAPGRRVICLSGDGSLQMNVQELATVAYHRLPIKLFLLNNNGYHSIRQTQAAYFPESPIGFQPDNGVGFPRAEGLAMAYGLPYLRLADHPGLAEGLERALALEGPALIEVVLDPDQPFAPKLASRRLPDGTMVSPALEDMAPFLPREELAENRPGLPGQDPDGPCRGCFGERVYPEAARRIEGWLPRWHQERLPIALYAAGGHTRDLLAHEGFAGLNIVGVVDRNRQLHGSTIGRFRVRPVEDLASLRPALVLVSSTWAHEEIREQLDSLLAGTGIRVLDPYEGIPPYAPLFALAERHGLRLEDSLPGRLRLSRPGPRTQAFIMNQRHWAYAKDVIEAFDYYFQAVRPDRETPVEQVVDIAEPGYHTLRESGTRLFFPALPEPDVTTRAYLEFAELRPGDHVLDLGAYAGASSLAFARVVGPGGRVLALEPDAENLAALRRNLADHGLAQVTAVRAAAWDKDGEAPFQTDGCLGSSLGELLPRTGNRVPVPTLTLATLVATHRIDSLRFIKMDIEGAETRVLAQALPLLRRLKPRLVIEPHLAGGSLNTGQVRQILEGGGFRTGLIGQGLGDYPLVTAWFPEVG